MSAWKNTELDIEARIDALMSEMTLAEKVGQTHQVANAGEKDVETIRKGQLGSTLFASGMWAGNIRDEGVRVEHLNSIQKIAVEESRLGIPLVFARDVIHGHRTVFPIPLGQAATWSVELIESGAHIAAMEARAEGIHWTFTPMLDIGRDPRWGRVAESFGEDPHLCGQLAKAAVRGYQGDDLTQPDTMAACAKHYVGYGGAEGGRDYNTVDIGPRSLRDTYLPSFKAAVDAGCATVMSSFNEIDGLPVTANREVLREILKQQWGFDGVVVTDWRAVGELMQHGVAEDEKQCALKALSAGADIDMISYIFIKELEGLIESGELELSILDDAVRRILRLKFRLGLFENPYTEVEQSNANTLLPESRTAARQCAAESMVLLKNENNALPLSIDEGDLLVTGPLLQAKEQLYGTWTLDGAPEHIISIQEALETRKGEKLSARFKTYADEAMLHVRYTDKIIVFLGEHPCRSGEADSIQRLDLPAGQLEFLKSLARYDIPVVAVVMAGRPLDLTEVVELADAVLFSFHPGIEGANAVVDVLTGGVNPCGRLPMTFPRHVGQIPTYYNTKNTGRPLPNTLRGHGRYADAPDMPLFPFGFGLSYTQFEYSALKLNSPSMSPDGEIQVSATITNTGDKAGIETVQLYVRDLCAEVTRPIRELKGFKRIALEAGESSKVSFTLKAEDLAYTGLKLDRILEPGKHHLWVAPNAHEGLQAEFIIEGERRIF